LIPQVDYANTLFKLARDEIDMNDWNESTKETSFRKFFRTFQRGSIYTSPEYDTILYLDIWKAAHQQLRAWSKQTLKGLSGGTFQEAYRSSELLSEMAKAFQTLKERVHRTKHHAL
jgi:hypothetical protein